MAPRNRRESTRGEMGDVPHDKSEGTHSGGEGGGEEDPMVDLSYDEEGEYNK